MTKCKQTNKQQGLYQHDYEHDACGVGMVCLLYTSPSPRDQLVSRMPSSA